MKRKSFFVLVNCILWIVEGDAKYLISANDSVNVQNCDLNIVRNISQLHASPAEIVIHNCRIDELPNALFLRFHQLRILEITESQLRAISDFAFNGLSGLQLLNLSRNNLTTVKTWSDANLEELNLLDLRRNAIASIHKYAFKRYPNLLKLHLAVNHISEIPDELFRSTPLLKYLNLGKNDLQSIDSHTFKHLHKLIHLELKHNQIELIEAESFVGCTHLKVLHLQENLISAIDGELFSNLPRLHHLNLSHNQLETFTDDTFGKSEELLSLDISFNSFHEFGEFTFKGLEVLEILNASHNDIQHIDGTIFSDFANLKHLDLSNNQITQLPEKTFDSMSLLKSIKLNNNSLGWIDDAVLSDLKLKDLDLSCNHLSSDNFLWTTVEIEHLNLTFNGYKEINASLLENIMMDFWGNPFSCEWLVKDALTSKNIRVGEDYVVDSKHNVLRVAGIQCFEEDGSERKLIVVESKLEISDEAESHLETLQDFKTVPVTQSTPDDFDFRSILLWLSCGCLGVFIALSLLKCLLRKSERQSENYRLSRHQAISIDDVDMKSCTDVK